MILHELMYVSQEKLCHIPVCNLSLHLRFLLDWMLSESHDRVSCVMTDSQLHVHFWSSSSITDILQWSREIISWIMSAPQTTKWRSGQEIDDLLYWFLTKWKLAGSRSGLCCLIKNKRKTTFYTWQMFPNVGAGKYSAVFSGMCSYRHITRCNCGKVFHPRYCTSMW